MACPLIINCWTILTVDSFVNSCLATPVNKFTVLKINITTTYWENYNPEEGVLPHRNMSIRAPIISK